MSTTIHLRFISTCSACPEQYDVYHEDRMVGYVRLRHGRLTAYCPDVFEELVYEKTFSGVDGRFNEETTRHKHLSNVSDAILEWMKREYDTVPKEAKVTYYIE